MDLFTRCPDCSTVFRVTTRHLQASGGQVRCGRCHAVFDAFASLTAKPPGENQTPAAAAEVESVTAAVTNGPERAAEPSASFEAQSTDTKNVVAKAQTAPVVERKRPTESDAGTNLYEWEFKPTPKQRRTGLWLTLSLLLFISALIQAGAIFRTEIMVSFPQVKPLYELACKRLSCEIGLPRLADQLNIDASDLQFIDPQRPNLVKLTALVRNRSRVPVEYPAFELTLTNAQEQVVARRVFLPSDYLEDTEKTDSGLAGRRELAVSLFLDTGALRAAGYRIYLFYP